MLLGLASISHKKKAKFWRGLVALFPQLIDYMCAEDDLKQVRPVGPSTASRPACARLRSATNKNLCAHECVRACARVLTHAHARARVCGGSTRARVLVRSKLRRGSVR